MTSGSPGLAFGAHAAHYHRHRPPLPVEAVNWLTEGVAGPVVDIGAGTGRFTSLLATRTGPVTAIEPDPKMRAELVKNCPDVQAYPGRAEQLPLDTGSVAAAFLSGVWHWVDVPRAASEIARVLAPGGRLGVCWNAPADLAAMPHGTELFPSEVLTALASTHRDGQRPGHFLLPDPSPFSAPERFHRQYVVEMTPQQVGELLTTYSAMLTPPWEARREELTQAAVAHASDQALRLNADTIPVRFVATCYRATLS